MPTIVKVALHVERAVAIRAGRNCWGWVPTELDLQILTEKERNALAVCPECKGTLYLTHVPDAARYIDRPEGIGTESTSWLMADRARKRFDREWQDGPHFSEATPETALAALRHLAFAPDRRLMAAQQRKGELEDLAAEHAAAAEQAARDAIADLDAWLAAPPEDLVTEKASEQEVEKRFEPVHAPHGLQTSTYAALTAATTVNSYAFEAEWDCAVRTIASRGAEDPSDDEGIFALPRSRYALPDPAGSGAADGIEAPPAPSLLGDAKTLLNTARTEREQAIKDHWSAISQAYWRKRNDFDRAKHEAFMRQLEERRAAERARSEALAAARKAASNEGLLAWARKHDHAVLAARISDNAPSDDIATALRAAVFDPLESEIPRYRKITKTDLLLANPGFREDARALEAEFEEHDAELGSGRGADIFARLAARLTATEVPAQYRIRRHRAVLKRRNAAVGVPVEACSVLVRAVFGGFEVSRAFALTSPIPVEG